MIKTSFRKAALLFSVKKSNEGLQVRSLDGTGIKLKNIDSIKHSIDLNLYKYFNDIDKTKPLIRTVRSAGYSLES